MSARGRRRLTDLLPVSDRALRTWLRTGRPARVERRLGRDPLLADRLERLTALPPGAGDALATATRPPPAAIESAVRGAARRAESLSRAGTIVDLVGLGLRTAGVLFRPRPGGQKPPGPPPAGAADDPTGHPGAGR